MPVIKSAIKKLRQDKKRTAVNKKINSQLNSAIKGIKKTNKVTLKEAYSKIDKAAKKGVIHKNKAARLKSQIAKKAPKNLGAKKATASKKTVKSSTKKTEKDSK